MAKLTVGDMIELIDELQFVRQEMKNLKTQETSLLEQIKAGLTQFDSTGMSGTYARVEMKTIESTRLDTKAVRLQHGTKYDIKGEYTRVDLKPLPVPVEA